jgi:hypothetical protein
MDNTLKLKDILFEVKDPGPKFVPMGKNYALIFVNIIKSNKKSILNCAPKNLDNSTPTEIIELCHTLNSIFDRHKSKFPCKIYFSDPDPKNWKSKGYSKILKNPCFNVCHFADTNSNFYEKEPHIVLEITKNFIDYIKTDDYLILQLNVSKALGHEIIHYLQHHKLKDYSKSISNYYKSLSVSKRYSQSVEVENIDQLIKDWTSGKKNSPHLRKNFCRHYMCCSAELSPQAFSCVSDLIFYEKLKNPGIDITDLKQKVLESIEEELDYKSRIFKIFINVAKNLQPNKFKEFKDMCKKYAENDVLY